MQKFRQNKTSSTITKRTIINFKKSSSIAKNSIPTQNEYTNSKVIGNISSYVPTQIITKKNTEQKTQFRSKVQLKNFSNHLTERPKIKTPQSQSFIMQKFNKSNIFDQKNKPNFIHKASHEKSAKYESIPKRPARKLNTPLKKFTDSKNITNNANSNLNPQDSHLLNTRKSKFEAQKVSNPKNIEQKRIKISRKKIQADRQMHKKEQIKQNQNKNKKQANKDHKQKEVKVSSSIQKQKIERKFSSVDDETKTIVSHQQDENVIFSRTYGQYNRNRLIQQGSIQRRTEQPENIYIQPQPLNIQSPIQNQHLHQHDIQQSNQISQRLHYAERINHIQSLQEVRQNQIQRLVTISQQNQDRETINIEELITNTSDIISFISRLNIRNDETFRMMIAQLTQLNTIAQQVNQLGQLGNRLGYSLVNVFGVRIRELQTSIVNHVGLALIRNFQQRMDPEFQILLLREPALKVGFSKDQISKSFPQKLNLLQSECSICLQQVIGGQLTISLQCKHEFHSNCISHWLQSSKKCPLCRFQQRI